jgi:hypothetical protein
MEAIDASWVRTEKPRTYLGASSIGGPCSRELWYGFRWALVKVFPPRVLRLFERGNREEDVFEQLLADAGVEFMSRDPATNKQYVVTFQNPHVGGHCDGVGRNLPDLPKDEQFIGEWKTHNDRSFKDLVKNGVEKSKPVHAVQCQLYMGRLHINWALYGAVNKNDDALYFELLEFNEKVFNHFKDRADLIVYSDTPPNRISQNPGWYECRFCDFHPVCHKGQRMLENCRTCTHVKPLTDGNWWCGLHDIYMDRDEQLAGCADHVQIEEDLEVF